MSPLVPRWVSRHVLLDLSPLRRSRDFRALIGGLGVSTLGNQLTAVSVPYQILIARLRRAAWGAAITGFGLVRALPAALLLLAVAGWADVVSAVFRNAIVQFSGPDSLRGRLMGVQMAVVAGGPQLGDLEARRAMRRAPRREVDGVPGG